MTQTQDPQPVRGTRDTQDPWERYGWIMGAIWLVFLMFPLTSAFTVETSWVWPALAIAAIRAFAAIYVYGFTRIGRTETWAEVDRLGLRCLAALLSLTFGNRPRDRTQRPEHGDLPDRLRDVQPAFGRRAGDRRGRDRGRRPGAAGHGCTRGDLVHHPHPHPCAGGRGHRLVRVLEQRGTEHQEIAGEMALVAERDRLAGTCTTSFGHSLTVVTSKAELAQRLVDADPERAKEDLAQIQSLTREALAEIRATVTGLRWFR